MITGASDPVHPGEPDDAGAIVLPADETDETVMAADGGATVRPDGDGVEPEPGERPTSGRVPRSERRGLRKFIPAPLLHIGRLLIIALIVEYLVVPQLAGTRDALRTLTDVNPLLLLLGVVLEGLAIAAYAMLTRAVLPQESDPGLFKLLRIQLTTLSVSHCVPGGSAAGSTLGYRLLTAAGVRRSDVGFALATQALGSAVVLNLIFWVALVVSIPVWGISPLYLTAAIVGAVLVGAFISLVLLFSRGEEVAERILRRVTRRLPFVDEHDIHSLFVRLSDRLRTLGHQPKVLAQAVGWAAANWLLDAASLFVFVGAFGHWVNPDGLLVAYGLANILAAIPLTPGGLGVVEATLTTALVGFDTTRAVAIVGVVAYRLVNFWMPIPLGGIAYLSLQVDPSPSARSRRDRARRVRDHAWGAAAHGRHEHDESVREGQPAGSDRVEV